MFNSLRMWLVGIGIIALLACGFYLYWNWSQDRIAKLLADNAKLEVVVREQQAAIKDLQDFQIKQAKALQDLQKGLNDANIARKALEEKFLSHDLEYLARNKPGLVENIINKATQDAFNAIEKDSQIQPKANPKGK